MIPRLAKNKNGSQTFWGVDDTDTGGVLGVIIDGSEKFYGDTLSATWDYCGVVEANALSAGTHTYQMMLDGVLLGKVYSFSIFKVGDDLEFMFIGDCLDSNASFQTIVEREHNIVACWGDEVSYIDGGEYGVNWANLIVSNNPNVASTGYNDADTKVYRDGMFTKHRGSIESTLNIARRNFYAKYPLRMLPGNHELESLVPGPNSKPGQNLYDGTRSAFYAYYTMGNPAADTVGVDSIPAEGVLYYSEILGNTEIVHCDILTYHDNAITYSLIGSAEGRGEDMQAAWLINIIKTTSAIFLIIYLGTAIPNLDEWTNATTGIFKALGDTSIPTVIVTANQHTAYAKQHTLFGANVMEIGISPLRQRNAAATETISGQIVYFEDYNASEFDDPYTPGIGPFKTYWIYGKVTERPNGSPRNTTPHMECEIINALTGYKRFSFTVDENKNIFVQNNMAVI